MAGAPALAARGALRAGAGLVVIAVPEAIQSTVAATLPEAIVVAIPDPGTADWSGIDDWWSRADAVVLGPGSVTGGHLERAWDELAIRPGPPRVLDGGAIGPGRRAASHSIWTPHPGEAARVLGCSAIEIQEDRFGALERLVMTLGGTIVLKGAHTLVGSVQGCVGVNALGSPALATAGSGDVLAGILAAELARGTPPPVAAERGVALHGLVGWIAGDRGLIAREIADGIPGAWSPRTGRPPEMAPNETLASWALSWHEPSRLL